MKIKGVVSYAARLDFCIFNADTTMIMSYFTSLKLATPCASVFLILTFLFSGSLLFSQEIVPLVVIEKLQADYPDEDVALFNGQRVFTFSYNQKTKLVEVNEESTLKYVNLSDKSQSVEYPIFVDDYSSVKSAKINKKKTYTNTFPYEMNGIFHHDAEVMVPSLYLRVNTETTNLNYEVHYTDSKYLTRRYIPEPYPVHQLDVKFVMPSYIEVDVMNFHFGDYDIVKSDETKAGIRTITFHVKDLPAFERESQSRGWAFYAPHLLILTKNVTYKDEQIKMLAAAEDLYSWYAGLVDGIGNDAKELTSFTEKLVKDCEDKDCEMKTIFYWVQDNIRYIAFEDGIAGFRPEACQDVMYNKYGDCKGMANLMAEMLKTRGFDARLTWIGTNSIPYDYSIPSLAVDNHMICTVVDDKGYHFLDGTEKYISFNDVAERIQGRQAMIQNGEKFEIVDVPEFPFERNEELTKVTYEVKDGKLVGHMDYSVKGEGKVRMFNRYNDIGSKDIEEAKRRFFSHGKKDIVVELVSAEDVENRESDLNWKANFEAKNRVNVFGSELYLDWDLYKSYGKASYDEEELEGMKGDMDFGSKVYDREEYIIEPLSGYSIKSTPEDFVVEDEHFKLKIQFNQKADGALEISKEFIIPKASIPNAKIESWSETIARMQKEIYKTPIIYEAK